MTQQNTTQDIPKKARRRSKKSTVITVVILIILVTAIAGGVYVLQSGKNAQRGDLSKDTTPLASLPETLASPLPSTRELAADDVGIIQWMSPAEVPEGTVTSYALRIVSELCPNLNTEFEVKAIDNSIYEQPEVSDEKPYTGFFKLKDTYILHSTVQSCTKNNTGTNTWQEIATAYVTAVSSDQKSKALPVKIMGRLFE